MLMVQDIERGVCFYRDLMGLDVKDQTPEWSKLDLGDAIIVLHGGASVTLFLSGLRFEVEDIRDMCLRAGGRGPRTQMATTRQWLDPCGGPGGAAYRASLFNGIPRAGRGCSGLCRMHSPPP